MVEIGKLYLLQTDYSDYEDYVGRVVKVERQLTPKEIGEEGLQMYLCTLPDHRDTIELNIYPDELYDLNTLKPAFDF